MKQALEAATMRMPAEQARAKVAEYLRAVRARHTREDEAILRGYRALAKGHAVVDLPAVIGAGGVFEGTQLPRLAVATSSHEFVHVVRRDDGHVVFQPAAQLHHNRRRDVFPLPVGTLPAATRKASAPTDNGWWRHPWDGRMRAMVPHVPPGLRPAHSLDGYVTLFEVMEWAPDPTAPADPALLKHIGGDLYAVLAVWDLTPLEQSVLNGRVR